MLPPPIPERTRALNAPHVFGTLRLSSHLRRSRAPSLPERVNTTRLPHGTQSRSFRRHTHSWHLQQHVVDSNGPNRETHNTAERVATLEAPHVDAASDGRLRAERGERDERGGPPHRPRGRGTPRAHALPHLGLMYDFPRAHSHPSHLVALRAPHGAVPARGRSPHHTCLSVRRSTCPKMSREIGAITP
jgi:hypothetical protein